MGDIFLGDLELFFSVRNYLRVASGLVEPACSTPISFALPVQAGADAKRHEEADT